MPTMLGDPSPGDARRSLFGESSAGVGMLLFTLLGPPTAWTFHFLSVYLLVALYCTEAWEGAGVAILVSTIASAAISIAAGFASYREWRRGGETSITASIAGGTGGSEFILLMGLLGSMLFSFLILVEAIAPVFVPLCSMSTG
ncbi:MAG: hypothetical protein GEU90_11645 [Gemmatimonas sp.]|nr:hypothetical protein [Gemmatimonas sp.]